MSDQNKSIDVCDFVVDDLMRIYNSDVVFQEIFNCYNQLDDRRKEFLRSYAAYLVKEGGSSG